MKELQRETHPGIIIGMVGGIGCGKSTAAEYLSWVLRGSKATFALPLKAVTSDMFGLDLRQLQTQAQKNAPLTHLPPRRITNGPDSSPRHYEEFWTARTLWEWFGTDVARKVDPDVWVNCARRTVDNYGGNLIFEDMRFPNEAKMVRDYGGFIIRVDVLENAQAEETGHESDQQWGDIEPNYTVAAKRGDLPGLFGQLHKIALEIQAFASIEDCAERGEDLN